MIYLRLFYEFFMTGLFSVGGGLATLPFLYHLSDKTGWFTYGQLADMLAVSEATPGPIGVNMATYVGFTSGGAVGAVVATLGLITPSIIVILIVARMLTAFGQSRIVKAVFYGLRPASVALIAAAGISVAVNVFVRAGADAADWTTWLDGKSLVLAALLLVLTRFVPQTKKLHPICFIALAALAGIAFRFAGA